MRDSSPAARLETGDDEPGSDDLGHDGMVGSHGAGDLDDTLTGSHRVLDLDLDDTLIGSHRAPDPDDTWTGSHRARDLDDSAEPGDFVEFVAAETAQADVDDGVPGRGWRGRLAQLAQQLLKFGLVGGVGFVIDMGLYNVLVLTVLSPETVAAGPIVAKVLSTLVAITTNWLGNRLWTFRHHRRHDSAREAAEFFAVSLAGLVVGLLPLWISHYLIGWTSLLSDNIANVIGLGLGSVFRFSLYRLWVFSPLRRGAHAPLPR